MRLKTKLVVAATGLTFAIVVILSLLFVSELMRQRIEQTETANDVLAHQVYLMMRQAMVEGLQANPPSDRSDEALHRAVVDALRSSSAADRCDECDCALLGDSAGRERDGCAWDDAGEHGPGCVESAGGVPVQSGERAEWRTGSADASGVRQAAGAGYFAVAGQEWSAVSGGACGGAIDVFEELV